MSRAFGCAGLFVEVKCKGVVFSSSGRTQTIGANNGDVT